MTKGSPGRGCSRASRPSTRAGWGVRAEALERALEHARRAGDTTEIAALTFLQAQALYYGRTPVSGRDTRGASSISPNRRMTGSSRHPSAPCSQVCRLRHGERVHRLFPREPAGPGPSDARSSGAARRDRRAAAHPARSRSAAAARGGAATRTRSTSLARQSLPSAPTSLQAEKAGFTRGRDRTGSTGVCERAAAAIGHAFLTPLPQDRLSLAGALLVLRRWPASCTGAGTVANIAPRRRPQLRPRGL